jgi:hypothetical protein
VLSRDSPSRQPLSLAASASILRNPQEDGRFIDIKTCPCPCTSPASLLMLISLNA